MISTAATRHLVLGSWLLASLPAVVFAQEEKVAIAIPTESAIRVDGLLEESVWNAAPAVTGFLQRDPREGEGAKEWGFYGGSNTQVSWSPLLKVSKNLSVSPRYRFNQVILPRGRFNSHLVNSQFNYAFSTRWLTSATAQYNNTTDFVGINLRLNYIYRSGDDFFLVYNEAKTLGEDGVPGRVNRSLIAKLTFSFDFY